MSNGFYYIPDYHRIVTNTEIPGIMLRELTEREFIEGGQDRYHSNLDIFTNVDALLENLDTEMMGFNHSVSTHTDKERILFLANLFLHMTKKYVEDFHIGEHSYNLEQVSSDLKEKIKTVRDEMFKDCE